MFLQLCQHFLPAPQNSLLPASFFIPYIPPSVCFRFGSCLLIDNMKEVPFNLRKREITLIKDIKMFLKKTMLKKIKDTAFEIQHQHLLAAVLSEGRCCTCSTLIRWLMTCVNVSACNIEPRSNSRASLESFTSLTTYAACTNKLNISQSNAVVTCEIKLFQNYFSLRRRPSEIILP